MENRKSLNQVRKKKLIPRLQRMSIKVIVDQTVAQDMKLNAADAECFVFGDLGDLVVRDLRAIYDGHRPGAKNFHHALAVKNDRCIFVDPDAQVIRIVRNRRDKAADASAFSKMLVNDDV